MRNVALLASLLLWCGSDVMAAEAIEGWHLRTPPASPTTEGFEGAAFGNGRWVVVGGGGAILSSPDGVQWTPEANPAGAAKLNDVAFGNGVFVAIGSGNGVVITSPDGRQWTRQSPESGGGLEIIHELSGFQSSHKPPNEADWRGIVQCSQAPWSYMSPCWLSCNS